MSPWTSPPLPSYVKTGPLSSEMCHAMLRDPTHLFRRMWAAEAWAPMRGGRPACWDRKRVKDYDEPAESQNASTYFDAALRGDDCRTNWYEGNYGRMGEEWLVEPGYKHEAAALLGFDESIDEYCMDRAPGWGRNKGHAERCIAASASILSLYGERVAAARFDPPAFHSCLPSRQAPARRCARSGVRRLDARIPPAAGPPPYESCESTL